MTIEQDIQAKLRIAASDMGWRLYRNNVGVLKDSRGVPVRYGLCNDSAQINSGIKSADLIGIRPVLITQEMVGTVIGQFASIECKRPGWKYNPNDMRQAAQMNWLLLVRNLGGWAEFNSTGEL